MTSTKASAAQRWRDLQQARAVPTEILAAAQHSPWKHNPAHFGAPATPDDTPSRDTALALLGVNRDPDRGMVLDVGCGGGSASIAVAEAADRLVGVDHDPGMIELFTADCAARSVEHRTVLGEWPEVADEVGMADVVVCHHVGYNTVDLAPFVVALTAAARRGVVMELTAQHPMTWLDPLWVRFHDLHRGEPATADDAVAVLAELDITPTVVRWERAARLPEDPVWVARRLCLPEALVDEVAEALVEIPQRPRDVVTLSW
ncbi:MAG: class I SAM-dependent methyltransferase [Pseudonocardiales bacterium]|nr:class I SAM-dependent methyltransferase [Pseudonocardiales bacterium]